MHPGFPHIKQACNPLTILWPGSISLMRRIIMLHYKLCLVPAGVEQLGPVFMLRTSRNQQLCALDV